MPGIPQVRVKDEPGYRAGGVLEFAEWKEGRQTDNRISGAEGLCSPDKTKIEHYLLSGKKLKGTKLVTSYVIEAGRN